MTPLLVARSLLLRIPPAPLRKRQLHRLDDEEEDGCGDRDELDHVGDEGAVAEHRVVDREGERAEIGLPDHGRDDRHHEVVDERVDDSGEGKSHHERDGELDQTAPHQEILELLQQRLHCLLLGPGIRKLRT